MRKLFVLFALMVVAGTGWAQTKSAFDEIKENPAKSGGVYYAYPVPTQKLTPAPKGYKVFYISHYGRHGSRYLLSDRDYSNLLNNLRKANDANVLTDLGKDALRRMELVWEEAEFHGDELAPLGRRQHRGIAERMFNNFPELFKKGAKVSARSTTSMRVALSMMAFVERLKELNPKLDLTWETTNKNMKYLNSHTQRYNQLKNNFFSGWRKIHNDFCARGISADRFVTQLFSDTTYFSTAKLSKNSLMTSFFNVAVGLQDMETDVSFYDLSTTEELYQQWLNDNSWFYNNDANSPHNEGTAMESTIPLLQNIIDGANAAIEGRSQETATLRFGHDGNIIPLAAIMHLKGCDAVVSDLNKMTDVWQNYYVSPMGANIQLVFFRKGDDVIVKFLLHEVETSIPIETDMYPYYHWKDVEKMFMEDINRDWGKK